MVVEWLSIANLFLNDFFAKHIVFISHMLAAVFLILTENTINMRIITPMLEGMENMMFRQVPLLPNLITTAVFIVWATFSIYLYQILFEFLLSKYEDKLSLILLGAFLIITVMVNIRYRD